MYIKNKHENYIAFAIYTKINFNNFNFLYRHKHIIFRFIFLWELENSVMSNDPYL